jgi:hypothetical protein
LRSRWQAATFDSEWVRRVAASHVPSVDPLSTIVIRHENGKPADRYACRRSMPGARARSSL